MSTAEQQARWKRRAYLYGQLWRPAAMTHRRLQALQSLGYSLRRLEGMYGVNLQGVKRSGRITIAVEARVKYIFEQLWDKPATWSNDSEHRSVYLAKREARRRNYPMPMDLEADSLAYQSQCCPVCKATAEREYARRERDRKRRIRQEQVAA